MKHLLLVLLFLSGLITLSAQEANTINEPKKIMIKLAQSKLLLKGIGGGVEIMLRNKTSIELGGTIKNVIPQVQNVITPYHPENDQVFIDVSTRTKKYFVPGYMAHDNKLI